MKLAWQNDRYVEVTWTEHRDADAPVLVIWPAFGTPATFYRHLTPALVEAGMSSVVVEYPGRDVTDGLDRNLDYGYDALATWVHAAVMAHVREQRPGARIFMLGHSLGGQVSLFAAALSAGGSDPQLRPDGVILAASASPYWRGYGWRGFPRSFLGTTGMALTARTVGYWPGDRLRFWGRQARTLVADWAQFARTGHVRPRGATADYEAALRRYDGDVLAISLPDDSFAPVAALENLLRLTPAARVTRWHAPVHVGHIQWVRSHATIVPIIAEWVRQHA